MTGLESKKTSLNQIPSGIKRLVEWEINEGGRINLDYGGGAYEKSTHYLMMHGIINLIYDPNQPEYKNKENLKICLLNGGANSATLLNVLNVIPTREERVEALYNMFSHMRMGSKAIIGVFEKNRDGILERTSKGWQLNQPLSFYKEEIEDCFKKIKIYKKEKFLIASF